ncbi:hypothetical protein [Noviherbaspirillum pedocola]|uniref:Uncharacterized protein n=1 Tax=Noviherbaspirillum pedocola TaxID=2801341 RepID=A0A934W697_9BURK|nr:hypothetical protein [Noviherbaspirillum pedocola]MBK4735942.1 hypothetical protein [Noviherbaspirillum pedocola]
MDNDFSHMRRPIEAGENNLTPEAIRWLGELPEDKRPAKLAADFARIVNKMALLWADCYAASVYLDSLMFDDRGKEGGMRQGFPLPVATELGMLKEIVSARIEARAQRGTMQGASLQASPTFAVRSAPKR